MIGSPWLSITGLVLDIAGALVLTYGLIISKEKAIQLGLFTLAADTDEERLRQPGPADRLKQSRNAVRGMVLLGAGFILQIRGTWPT